MAIDPIELTKRLVDIESTTYHEGECGEFLAEYLLSLGYDVTRQPVPPPDPARTPGALREKPALPRFNIYAVPRSDGGFGVQPEVVFSTHFDTVPPFLGPCSEDETHLYGRGVCDAKGILAAQVAASQKLLEEGILTGLLFVVGEERDSAGAKIANELPLNDPPRPRFLINGEPTDNRLALASKGCLRVELHASGKMAHSAYPELGDSAINKLLTALENVRALQLPIVEGIGDTTLNIGILSGGRAPNVIPDKAEAHLLIRLVGPAEGIRKSILAACEGLCEVLFTLELPFVQMRALDGFDTMVAKFTTDIPSLTTWGEPLLLGPGSIHVAHTPDEKILKRELLDCVDLYVRAVKMLCS
jgi:acetylornithine deacetylase